MNIGLKFCGGCNPRHDRSKFAERIRQKFGMSYRVEIAEIGKPVDYLLLIGGCTSCCADGSLIPVRRRVFRITREEDFESVVDNLDLETQEG